MTDFGRAGIYAAAWVPATALAIAAEGLAIEWVNSISRSSSWAVDLSVNLLPALLAAFLVFLPVAYYLHRNGSPASISAHLLRGSILYVLVVILALVVITSWRNPDFWLFGQLLIWPGVAAIAGLAADLLVWGLPSTSLARAA